MANFFEDAPDELMRVILSCPSCELTHLIFWYEIHHLSQKQCWKILHVEVLHDLVTRSLSDHVSNDQVHAQVAPIRNAPED
jgi:hypothetical protein